MKNRLKMTAIVTSAALFMCACGTNVNEDATPQEGVVEATEEEIDGNKICLNMLEPTAYANVEGLALEPGTYISIVGKSADDAYWKEVEAGAKQAVADMNEKLGYEGSDKIKIVYSGPSEGYNVDEQINILDEELARYPQAVGIALVDAKSCGVQFDLAAQNGISVVTFDTTSEYQGVMARVETDNAAAATEAGARLAEAMGEMGEVTIFMDDSKSTTSQERESAFVEEITSNHPGVTVGNIYHMDDLDELKDTIAAEINTGTYEPESLELSEEDLNGDITKEMITNEEVYEYIFARNVDTAGIYTSSSALMEKAVKYCEKYNRADIEIVGFDANESQIQALKDGKVDGLVLQNPYGMGYATVVACARAILGEGNEAVVDSGYTWISQKNIEEEAVQSILY